jgi:hypothetical protein
MNLEVATESTTNVSVPIRRSDGTVITTLNTIKGTPAFIDLQVLQQQLVQNIMRQIQLLMVLVLIFQQQYQFLSILET